MSKISKKSAPILVGVVLLLIALTLLVPILYEFPHHPLDWTLGKIIVIVIGVIALVIGMATLLMGREQL
jgi:protein-S-isoprenylcysteine O-methyltransferase Ste14